MTPLWACPACHRTFRRPNQRHACGTGDRTSLLRDRPATLVQLYDSLEAKVRSFGPVEIVTRDRYALFRTTRIFTDLTVMRDALRVVIHLDRQVTAPCFVRTGRGSARRVSHVALVRTGAELRALTPWLREAYRTAAGEDAG